MPKKSWEATTREQRRAYFSQAYKSSFPWTTYLNIRKILWKWESKQKRLSALRPMHWLLPADQQFKRRVSEFHAVCCIHALHTQIDIRMVRAFGRELMGGKQTGNSGHLPLLMLLEQWQSIRELRPCAAAIKGIASGELPCSPQNSRQSQGKFAPFGKGNSTRSKIMHDPSTANLLQQRPCGQRVLQILPKILVTFMKGKYWLWIPHTHKAEHHELWRDDRMFWLKNNMFWLKNNKFVARATHPWYKSSLIRQKCLGIYQLICYPHTSQAETCRHGVACLEKNKRGTTPSRLVKSRTRRNYVSYALSLDTTNSTTRNIEILLP